MTPTPYYYLFLSEVIKYNKGKVEGHLYKFGAHFIYRPDSAVERWEILAASFHPTSAAVSVRRRETIVFSPPPIQVFPPLCSSLISIGFVPLRVETVEQIMWWPLCARSGFLWCLSSVQRLGVWLWVWVVQITEPFYEVGRVVESILWLFVV